nr:helix-turn-helix transcriptional regulator [Tissierella sp.]
MNGDLLRGKRAEHGFSQEDMANNLGVSRLTYRLKETGDREFTNSEMRKIASILDLKLNEINSIFFNNKIT